MMQRPSELQWIRFPALFLLLLACGCNQGGGSGGENTGAAAPAGIGDLLGGDTTVFMDSADAFGQPLANLSVVRRDQFFVGNSIFRRNWVTAPSSTEGQDGLGPLFIARSCSSCHLRDGRGAPPERDDEQPEALLFRISLPGTAPGGPPIPVPGYGLQIQNQAILGVAPEAAIGIARDAIPGQYADGEPFELQRPVYSFNGVAYGPLPLGMQVSPRIATALIGLGLLAAVDELDIRARQDEMDADGDGISGRANEVVSLRTGLPMLGRFGWKASQPTLEEQNAGAFLGDIGITSSLMPREGCEPEQADCQAAPTGGEPEVDDDKMDFLTFYTRTLAPPARRGIDNADVQRGEAIFGELGCAGCHIPTMTTGTLPDFPELSGQEIHPFTDLLLHDMGEGLEDGRDDFRAGPREWRTPPLWGIGLVPTVNGHTRFLHDGRARNLPEAILWHGGEGEAAQQAFSSAPAADRQALIRFLESL